MGKSRIASLDLARGLAVLFMVMVHVMQQYGTPGLNDSLVGSLIEFLGGPPAAPVFMFLMGTSLALSTRATLKRLIFRGLKLLLLAYFLNFLRFTLPIFLGLRSSFITLDDIAPYTPASLFWIVDILQFAGLALIVLALVRRFLPKPAIWLILAASVAIGSPLLWGRMSGNPVVDWLLTLLWGMGGEDVAFPVFPWLCYPLTGMTFGFWLSTSCDRKTLFKRTAGAGLGLLALGTGIILTNPDFHIGDYWRSGPGALIWITGFVLLWLAICEWLVKSIPVNAVFHLLYYWSIHVTVFYFLQWVIIGWGTGIVGYQEQGWLPVVVLMIIVALLADFGTRGWVRLTRRAVPLCVTRGDENGKTVLPK